MNMALFYDISSIFGRVSSKSRKNGVPHSYSSLKHISIDFGIRIKNPKNVILKFGHGCGTLCLRLFVNISSTLDERS